MKMAIDDIYKTIFQIKTWKVEYKSKYWGLDENRLQSECLG